MRFYATQVSIRLRIVWGIITAVLAYYEFKPPQPDVIGGIVLALIAIWCGLTAVRIAWNIGRIKLWP